MNTENFTQWIMTKDNLRESSKSSYLRVPSKVDVFLNSHGYEYERIMDIINPNIIKEILAVPELKEKYERENRTISSILTTNLKLRAKHMNRTEVLDRVGDSQLLPNTELATTK